jgi:hypothetical protein
MSTDQAELSEATDEKQDEIWTGEPIALHRNWGDRLHAGILSWHSSLPAAHVHPAVRGAATKVLLAQARRDEMQKWLDERPADRARLVARLNAEEPDEDAAAERLATFDGRTELRAARLPGADEELRAAWDGYAAALAGHLPALSPPDRSWEQYLRQRLRARVESLAGSLSMLAAGLQELRMLDDLLSGVGVIERTAEGATPMTIAHDTRSRSIESILYGGAELTTGGTAHGLVGLLAAYRGLAEPKPAPEPEADPDPGPWVPPQYRR